MISFIIILVAIGLIIDLGCYFGLYKALLFLFPGINKTAYTLIYWSFSLITVLLTVYTYLQSKDPYQLIVQNKHYYLSGYFIATYLPKITFLIGVGLFLLVKFFGGLAGMEKVYAFRFVLIPFLFLATINLIFLTHGIIWGKFMFTAKNIYIQSDKISTGIDGLKIVQISDFHIGSFYNYPHQVQNAVNIINKLNPDMIVFTGDMVNILAEEAKPHIETLQKLKAPLGKFAILGNHDYGAYYEWQTQEEKQADHEKLQDYIKAMGFDLLLNENRIISVNGDSLAIIGVENWGKPPFPQHGQLSVASEGIPEGLFKLLLSHDPTHWDYVVLPESDIDLTLSGHTHAMQMGIEIGRFKFSPSKFVYPRWNGLYAEGEQKLYVNRGIGFIGFPGRAGIWPEITMLQLKKSK